MQPIANRLQIPPQFPKLSSDRDVDEIHEDELKQSDSPKHRSMLSDLRREVSSNLPVSGDESFELEDWNNNPHAYGDDDDSSKPLVAQPDKKPSAQQQAVQMDFKNLLLISLNLKKQGDYSERRKGDLLLEAEKESLRHAVDTVLGKTHSSHSAASEFLDKEIDTKTSPWQRGKQLKMINKHFAEVLGKALGKQRIAVRKVPRDAKIDLGNEKRLQREGEFKGFVLQGNLRWITLKRSSDGQYWLLTTPTFARHFKRNAKRAAALVLECALKETSADVFVCHKYV